MAEKLKDAQNKFQDLLTEYKIVNSCLKGCVDCCYDNFYISYAELTLIMKELMNKNFIDLDYYLQKAYQSYRFYQHSLTQELLLVNPFTFNSQLSHFFSHHDEGDQHLIKHLPACIMLRNKKCDVYTSRPNVCRLYGTTIKCEYINNPTYAHNNAIQKAIDSLYESSQSLRLPIWYWFILLYKKTDK